MLTLVLTINQFLKSLWVRLDCWHGSARKHLQMSFIVKKSGKLSNLCTWLTADSQLQHWARSTQGAEAHRACSRPQSTLHQSDVGRRGGQLNVKSICNSHLSVIISSGTCFLPDRQPRQPPEEPEREAGPGSALARHVLSAELETAACCFPTRSVLMGLPCLHWADNLVIRHWPLYLLNRLLQVKAILKISVKEFLRNHESWFRTQIWLYYFYQPAFIYISYSYLCTDFK